MVSVNACSSLAPDTIPGSVSLQAMIRADLPFYMVPFNTGDLIFRKPEVCATIIN